jgi:hypothetical protein
VASHRAPTEIIEQQSLEELIAKMSESESKSLLRSLTEDPTVREQTEVLVALTSTKMAGEAAQDMKRAVEGAFKRLRGLTRSQGLWQLPQIFATLRRYLKISGELLAKGKNQQAVAQVVALTEAYMQLWTDLDGSTGETTKFLTEIAPVLTEAILSNEIGRENRLNLMTRAARWDSQAKDYGVDNFDPVCRALEGGPEAVSALTAPNLSDSDEVLATAWLSVLANNARHRQYLEFAGQAGHHRDYAVYQATQGDIAASIEYAEQYVGDADSSLSVFEQIWAQGAKTEALKFGLAMLNRLPQSDGKPAQRIADCAAALGWSDESLRGYQLAFQLSPALGLYDRVKFLAATQWPAISQEIWHQLQGEVPGDIAVHIFLQEGKIPELIGAWDKLVRHNSDLLEDVGKAALAEQPDWVIERVSKEAMAIIDGAQSPHYRQAARLLAIVRDAYRASDNDIGWQTYKSGILFTHKYKYTLVPLISPL